MGWIMKLEVRHGRQRRRQKNDGRQLYLDHPLAADLQRRDSLVSRHTGIPGITKGENRGRHDRQALVIFR
jgi:hypothetical protein